MIEQRIEQWYCLKAKIKREHFAAAILISPTNLEVFCPRVTITKNTIRGPKPFTEALFPGYLFSRFDFEKSSRLVKYSQDVIGIVKFGDRIPVIPDKTITQLKVALPGETAEIKPPRLQEGELAEIIQGCLKESLGG